MLISLTVGKVDAGVAVLLTEDKRLIEFPSILLPPDIASGSIVDVHVSRNHGAERQTTKSFNTLQSQILSTFGSEEPSSPILRCRNATQTSVVLEWDPISLAKAELRSLSLYRNGAKAGNIPRPLEMTSTKISGLALNTEYTFSLVLRTSAGTYSSEKLAVRTHKMTDLSGITVTPGFMPDQLREALNTAAERIGAKVIDQVRIDTTHFVCTEERGHAWEKAREMNIPVVVPDWIYGCEREGRLVSVRGYYLNADPKLRQVGPPSGVPHRDSQQSIPQRRVSTPDASRTGTPTTNVIPPTPERRRPEPEEDDSEEEEPQIVPSQPSAPVENNAEESEGSDDSDDDKAGPDHSEMTSTNTKEDERNVSEDTDSRGPSTSNRSSDREDYDEKPTKAETFDEVAL